jgi:hypothetical protein
MMIGPVVRITDKRPDALSNSLVGIETQVPQSSGKIAVENKKRVREERGWRRFMFAMCENRSAMLKSFMG